MLTFIHRCDVTRCKHGCRRAWTDSLEYVAIDDCRNDTSLTEVNLFPVIVRNVIPCNLSHDSFLSSEISWMCNETVLITFLRCYGYLMYDRDVKLNAAVNGCADAGAMRILAALNECRDPASFEIAAREQLDCIKSVIISGLNEENELLPAAFSSLRDNNDAANGTNLDEDVRNVDSKHSILRLAVQSLEKVVSFLRDTAFLERGVRVNEFCRRLLARSDRFDSVRRARHIWTDVPIADAGDVLSRVLQDAIVTTGLDTHTMFMYIFRYPYY